MNHNEKSEIKKMVFYAKQSNGRGKRIYPTTDIGLAEGRQATTVELDVPLFWGRESFNGSPAGIRGAIAEDFIVDDEDLPTTSALGSIEREFEASSGLLQERWELQRRRSINETREAFRLGRY